MKQPTNANQRVASSFRDPNGFLYRQDKVLYRQINRAGRDDYEHLMNSGLYQELVEKGLLIPHHQVDVEPAEPALAYQVIRPEPLPFVSYPYEWCFSQLKDAALITLAIQKQALEYNMSLKDCSAYNIQFLHSHPVLIDTLSFTAYQEGKPWDGYRQFCQHFLAPLALMAYRDVRLGQLLRAYIDGIPLDLASALLPLRSRLYPPLLFHIHLHARMQRRYANKPAQQIKRARQVSKIGFLGLIDNLESAISRLKWSRPKTEWTDYYAMTHYTAEATAHKQQIVATFIEHLQPSQMWDLGANIGRFSRLASKQGIFTVAFDIDPGAVEQNYTICVERKEEHLLPLLLDLTNPSPALGWQHHERLSLMQRGPLDLVLALALIHHLAIGNNVPLEHLARFFGQVGRWLIVEFVPKSDPQVQHMLSTRRDIFPDYTPEGFERAFEPFFQIHAAKPIRESDRIVYLMENKKRV